MSCLPLKFSATASLMHTIQTRHLWSEKSTSGWRKKNILSGVTLRLPQFKRLYNYCHTPTHPKGKKKRLTIWAKNGEFIECDNIFFFHWKKKLRTKFFPLFGIFFSFTPFEILGLYFLIPSFWIMKKSWVWKNFFITFDSKKNFL